MMRLLLLGLAALTNQATGESQEFANCICPPVDDVPELGPNMDPGTGCPKGDMMAAEIGIENYGSFLVATSLNLRLSYLPELNDEEKLLPLYLVADTIRVDQHIPKYHSKVVAFSRRLLMRQNGNFTDPSDFEFHTKEVEIDHKSPLQHFQHTLNIDETATISETEKVGLHQLLDFVELKSVTTDTFDTRNADCPGLVKSNNELDSLTPSFSWIREQAILAEDQSLLLRTNLLQRYRGGALEGPVLDENIDEDELNRKEIAMLDSLMVQFKELEGMASQHGFEAEILSALTATSELISGSVSDMTVSGDWSKRLSIFTRVQQLQFMIADIEAPISDNDKIYRKLSTYWPKENDFEDFKYTVYSMFNQMTNTQLYEIRNKWVMLIRNLEHFYFLKNIKFDIRLKKLQTTLRTKKKAQANYQNRLSKWTQEQLGSINNNAEETSAFIELDRVPVNKFVIGEFTQRYWISDQRFNNFAHLRVKDISVSIEGLSDAEVRSHLKIKPLTSIMYDINEVGEQVKYTSIPTEYPLYESSTEVTPFTLWRFLPDNHLVGKIQNLETIKISITFSMRGLFVEGLNGRVEDGCAEFDDDELKFSECKYAGKAPFHLTYDIVSVMHLKEINNLFRLKYEEQQKGNDSGVITDMSTDWSEPFSYECETSPFGYYKEIRRTKIVTVLDAPLMYFPPELPGYMELYFDLNEGAVSTESTFVDCNTNETLAPNLNNATLSGAIALTISLEKVKGIVDTDEDVILDLSSTAITDLDFSIQDPLFTDALKTLLKSHFQKHFTSVQLATIKYEPGFEPPVFVQPSKFYFQTVCNNCTYTLDGLATELDGYLITAFQTKSINHVEVQYPSDPHNTFGLDHAIPANVFTAGVFLGAHITFCDIYFPSFQGGEYVEDMFIVTKERSSDPNKPNWQELYVKYRTDMCIEFGEQNFKSEGVMSIYQDSFAFNSETQFVRNRMSNAIVNQPEKSGRDLGNILAGYDDGVKQCGQTRDCDAWWKWILMPEVCLVELLVYCVIDWCHGTYDVWSDATIAIYKDESTPLQYIPECYSFQFPPMTFEPEIDISLNEGAQNVDNDLRAKTRSDIKEATQAVLAVKFTESPSVSLFTAVNLLFPGQKVIDNSTFFSPGTVIMYGNIVGEYIEQPVFGPECPEYDQTSGKFIRF